MSARVMVPLEQPGHQSVLAERRCALISVVVCGLMRGSLGSPVGCASSLLLVDQGAHDVLPAVVVELGLDELDDLLRRDELAVHAPVVHDLGAAR